MENPQQFLRSAIFYSRGLAHYRARRWASAEALFSSALQERPEFAEALFKLGMCHFRQEDWQSALVAMQAAIDLDPSKARWTVQRDQAIAYLEAVPPASPQEEEELLRARITAGGASANTYTKLADNFAKQGRLWQQIDALEQAIAHDPEQAGLHFRLGDVLDRMRRYRQAAQAFAAASSLEPANATYAFRLGFALEREGIDGPADPQAAAAAYQQAIAADKSGAAARFGVGVFHQKRGFWKEAAIAYTRQLEVNPHSAELHYRLGLACDRQFEWEQAEGHLARALTLDPSHANRHARLGFVLERQGKFVEAAEAYGHAAQLGGKAASDRRYRQGFVLAQAGAYEEAAEAFRLTKQQPGAAADDEEELPASDYATNLAKQGIKLIEARLAEDYISPDLHFGLAQAHEALGNREAAAQSYRNAIDRSDAHQADWYFSLGTMLAKSGRFREASEAFIETRCLTAADGWIDKKSLKNHANFRRARYAEYYERLAIRDKTVLYESFHGRPMGCNPLAIFRELLTREEFADWTHIWVIDDRSKVAPEYRALKNLIVISRNSDTYMRALASTKILINNTTFLPEFTRKDGQIYLNTWHGTPIKTLGKFIRGGITEYANSARNFLQSTHLLSPNQLTSEVLVDHYDIGGLFSGKIAEIGYPRLDATVALPEAKRQELRDRLGAKPGQKIILYAPTFRGSWGNADFDHAELIADLEAMQRDGYHLVFRGHHATEKMIAKFPISCTIANEDIDSNSLLAVVDLLVSDYSSIAIDFLPRRKPVIYYAYDLEEYEGQRGLYLSLSELPGEVVETREDLRDAIANAETRYDEAKHEAAITRFNPSDDGHVSRRVVDWVFLNKAEGLKILPDAPAKKVLFFPGAMIPNGIASSFVNLTSHLDYTKYPAACLIDSTISQHEDRLDQLARLPEKLNVIPRIGAKPFTAEENWVENKFDTQHRLSEPMLAVLQRGYQREFRRIFGSAQVDSIINFEGYARFFQRLFAFAPPHAAKRKVLYLHNDMAGEWRERFPYLEGCFGLYSQFQSLVSVSETLCDLNRKNLSDSFAIPGEKFVFAENMHNPDYITAAAEAAVETPDEQALFDDASVTFLTMGRMSLEKDQAKLIRAFRSVASAIPTARLFVLGDGPLRHELVATIKALKLTDNVFLLGQKPNPFPYLKRADCFVLPSNHEGQPMVLLEALILNRPIIATDISGNRGALNGRPGRLVENSEEGLAAAMLDFAKSPTPNANFDIDAYQHNALAQFIGILEAPVRP